MATVFNGLDQKRLMKAVETITQNHEVGRTEGLSKDQADRKASTIFILAARTAGSRPPTNPMTREKASDFQAISKVRVKLKASSEKVCQFMVEMVMSCMKEAQKNPEHTPRPARGAAIPGGRRPGCSPCRKPRARSVPISVVRLATAAYMVIMAPIIAPREKMTVRVRPEDAQELGHHLGLVGVVSRLPLRLHGQTRVALDAAL